jgi:hypothetical protein
MFGDVGLSQSSSSSTVSNGRGPCAALRPRLLLVNRVFGASRNFIESDAWARQATDNMLGLLNSLVKTPAHTHAQRWGLLTPHPPNAIDIAYILPIFSHSNFDCRTSQPLRGKAKNCDGHHRNTSRAGAL